MMVAHVDDLCGFLCSTESGFADSRRLAHEGDDGAVGGFARVDVEQADAVHRLNSVCNLFDNAHVAALTEVRHALNDLFFLCHIGF